MHCVFVWCPILVTICLEFLWTVCASASYFRWVHCYIFVYSHLSDVGCLCGSHEAVELRDDDKAVYMGKGVLKAVANVNDKIAPAIMGMDPTQQGKIDKTMMEVDKTENKVCTKIFVLHMLLNSKCYWCVR